MTLKSRSELIELQQQAKVIFWISEGLTAYTPDLSSRIHTIAELCEQLAEDSYKLSANVERNSDD